MNLLEKIYKKVFYGGPVRASVQHCKKKNAFELMAHTVKTYAIIMLDEQGYVTTWNNGAEHLHGYTTAEIIGQSCNVFYNQQDIYDGAPSHHLQMTKIYGFCDTDGWRLRKDGSCFFANTVYTALKDDRGQIYGYATITRDITPTKKIQQQLEILSQQINQSNDSIYTVDANYRITGWNRGAEKLYGYTSEEALGKIPNELLHTDISKQDLSAALQVIDDNGYWAGELKRTTKSGSVIYVRSSTSAIRDAAGTMTGMIGVSFDITAQKELQEQVSRLASVVEQSADGIRVIGLDGKIVTWNKGSELLHGYTKEEAIGKTPYDLGIIDLTSEEQQLFFSAVIKKGSVETERHLFHKSGSSFFGSITASVHTSNEGIVDSLIFAVKDISLRRSLEEQLKKSNEELEQKVKERTEEIYKTQTRFKALVENSQSIITLFDKDIKPVYRSPAGERVTGWTAEDRQKYTLLEQIHPDHQADQIALYKKVLENPGKTFEFTTRSLHKAGHYIWLEGVATNMLHDPGVAGIISNLADITERREAADAIRRSEILYRSLFENMLHGFAYCKAIFEEGLLTDFTFITVNTEYELMHNRFNISGKNVSAVIPDLLSSDASYKDILTRVALLGTLEKIETYVKPLDKWFSISLYSPAREYFVILSDDITGRKEHEQKITSLNEALEERVQLRTEELKKINEELEAFSYSVSHDLRAPLRGITGFTTILEEDYTNELDEEAKRITAVIKNNALRMGLLIDDLLSFSRMSRQDIVKTTVDMAELISEIISETNLQRNELPAINWIIHPMPAVKADINTIRQVWINLISNAVKYTGKSVTPAIEIGARTIDKEVVFYVKDNGAGFDEKYTNKLFRVFQRLHSHDEFEGTGIGLAIVEKIISKHNGKVWAEASVNKGACFYFSLPASIKKEKSNTNKINVQ